MDDFIDTVFQILFLICLFSPVLLIVGFILYGIGSILQKSNTPSKLMVVSKKIMLFSALIFMIGMGACFTLMKFYNPFIGYNPDRQADYSPHQPNH